jgi:hypothetical protein
LLANRQPNDAIKVYLEDLERFPKNGWALSGLKQAYLDAKQPDKADQTDIRLREAWAHADVKLKGSKVENEE